MAFAALSSQIMTLNYLHILANHFQIYASQINYFLLIPPTNRWPYRTHTPFNRTNTPFVRQQHHDWLKCLSLADFSYNNAHFATKFSPFEAMYALNPITHANILTNNPTSAPLDVISKFMISTPKYRNNSNSPMFTKPRAITAALNRLNSQYMTSHCSLWLTSCYATSHARNFDNASLARMQSLPKLRHTPTASASPNPYNAIMFSTFQI
jgi:hypothetical protein